MLSSGIVGGLGLECSFFLFRVWVFEFKSWGIRVGYGGSGSIGM